MYLVVCFLVVYFNYVCCQSGCSNFKTCGGCITYIHNHCVWCPAKDHEGARCTNKEHAEKTASWCNDTVYDPESKIDYLQNDTISSGPKVVQFQPQHITIKARPGDTVNFTMTYKPAKDYPLDVYYLMDSSYTMSFHKRNLMNQAQNIYGQLTKLTNNVRLGVGSFIEKPGLPFGDTIEQYSFKNHLKLTDNVTIFTEAVNTSSSGGNYDNPESGLDALMQAIVCKNEIGWRDKARRIIVYCTDDTYHRAYDGKMVGAFRPNDMKCHLDNDSYSQALNFDYPSISQINYVAKNNSVNIIFAIAVKGSEKHYRVLEKKIGGSKCVSLGSNVADMIKEEYTQIVTTVKLTHTLPNFVQLVLDPDCSGSSDECVTKHNENLDIKASLKINSCPSNKKNKYSASISPQSFDEKLNIDIELVCECECEKLERSEVNSKMCNEGGTYQCGVCSCNKDRYGDTCLCNGTSTDIVNNEECRPDNITKPCSGRGYCRCGRCDCEVGFSGDYCQFNDAACPAYGGNICSGNGVCTFGKCACETDWEPDDCRCPSHKRDCIAPRSTEVCSGNGYCNCGKCECFNTNINKTCSGTFCDDCVDLTNQCKQLEDYAYCQSQKLNDCNEQYNQTNINVEFVSREEINSNKYYMATRCNKILDDGSVLIFLYDNSRSPTKNYTQLTIQSELDLPPVANIWVAVGSALATVLLIGLLTLFAWKYLVDLHDQREYQKFSKDSAAAGYDVSINPLYQSPATNFCNPVYNDSY